MLDIEQIKQVIPHRYPFLLGRPNRKCRRRQKCSRIQKRYGKRTIFPRTFPELHGDAWCIDC